MNQLRIEVTLNEKDMVFQGMLKNMNMNQVSSFITKILVLCEEDQKERNMK